VLTFSRPEIQSTSPPLLAMLRGDAALALLGHAVV
jgi:hypothetical protein